MSKTVYLNISQITEVHHKEVQLKDVATVYSDDSAVTNKCNALRIKNDSIWTEINGMWRARWM